MTLGQVQTAVIALVATSLLMEGCLAQNIVTGFSVSDVSVSGSLPETAATGQAALPGDFVTPTDEDISNLSMKDVSAVDVLGDLVSRARNETVIPTPAIVQVGEEAALEIAVLAKVELERFEEVPIGKLVSACGCSEPSANPVDASGIREISNMYMSGGEVRSKLGHSNFLWAWGQWIDHNLVATLTDKGSATSGIVLDHAPSASDILMQLKRLEVTGGTCKVPKNALTPLVDASTVYSPDEDFEQQVLREPGTCKLRVNPESTGGRDHLPLTTKVSAKGNVFFVAGDVRVNEHSVLSVMHTIWLREHNRLCDKINTSESAKARLLSKCNSLFKPTFCKGVQYTDILTPSERFELAKRVVQAKIQHITVEEFLPALGISKAALKSHMPKVNVPDISIEFATAAYRFGHDLVPDTIGSRKVSDIFGGEVFLLKQGGTGRVPKPESVIDSLLTDLAREKSGQIDGKVGEALRNILFGPITGSPFGEDLVSRNIFRGRDMKMKSYPEIAQCFGLSNTKAERIPSTVKDAFPHLLADNDQPNSQTLGPVARAIILDQFHRSFFGKGSLYYKNNLAALQQFQAEVTSTKLSSVVRANTGATVQNNIFKV